MRTMSDLESLVKNKALFRILVVDDKANMRRTLRNMLRMMGFNNFNDAEDGDVALKKIKSEKFDFVICDWNMPRMNGVELLKAIREDDRFKNLPFLMITAEVEEGTVAESIEAEVDGYILKPFVPKTLEDKIIEILTRKQSPSQVETFLLAAETLIKSGAYNRAMEEVNKAARISPRSPKVHYYKGLILEGAGDMAEAEKSYIQARKVGPKFIKAHEKLANIYQKTGRTKELVAVVKEAVKVSPKNADRQIRLGEALLSDGRIQEANLAFNNAVRIDSTPERKNLIGEVYLTHGMAAEAEKAFKSAIKSNPSNIHAYNRLGIAFRRQKKYDEAVTYYLMALDIDPGEQNILYNLARAYLGAGKKDKALNTLKRAIAVAPDFQEARVLMAKIEAS